MNRNQLRFLFKTFWNEVNITNNEQDKINQILSNIDNEYYVIVKDILENEEFKKRLNYHHHENKSVFLHSLMVSIYLKLLKN